jgi:hypothetical protein
MAQDKPAIYIRLLRILEQCCIFGFFILLKPTRFLLLSTVKTPICLLKVWRYIFCTKGTVNKIMHDVFGDEMSTSSEIDPVVVTE